MRLPKNLENLSFGWSFNQPLEQIFWPTSLQSLTFGGAFNQSLENVEWPENMQSLTFGQEFDQSLESLGEVWVLSESFSEMSCFAQNKFVPFSVCSWCQHVSNTETVGISGPEGLLWPKIPHSSPHGNRCT